MTILYTRLAGIYHEMYRHIFDYDKEFLFYDAILKQYGCKSVLEVACGSGMLAQRFLMNGYNYTGTDLSTEMLDIAREEVDRDVFLECDMRRLQFRNQFDAVLITGHSLAYLTENQDITDTFTGLRNSLKDTGILVFGVFDAESIFSDLNDFEQTIRLENKQIRRISKLERNMRTGWTYDWQAKYIIEEGGSVSEYDDTTTLRAFTKDEIKLFLKLGHFRIARIIDEGKAFNIIAEKIVIKL